MASSSEAPPRPYWRLVKTAHAAHAFDGEGARLHGGRWNSPGLGAVYVGSSLALCVVELLVHLDPAAPLPALQAFSLHVPPELIQTAPPSSNLPTLVQSRRVGDDWLRQRPSAALAVPSIVVPPESNLLLNPAHPDFARIRIDHPVPFRLDPRLLAGG